MYVSRASFLFNRQPRRTDCLSLDRNDEDANCTCQSICGTKPRHGANLPRLWGVQFRVQLLSISEYVRICCSVQILRQHLGSPSIRSQRCWCPLSKSSVNFGSRQLQARACGEIGFNILEILPPSGAIIHQHILQVRPKANPASNATNPPHPAPHTLTVPEAVLVAAPARPCSRRRSRRGAEGTGRGAAG